MPARGFSVPELLVCCALLAALAYVALGAANDADAQSYAALSEVQLQQAALAVRRFRADTGYWPGEPPLPAAAAHDLGVLLQRPANCENLHWCRQNGSRGWYGPYLQPDKAHHYRDNSGTVLAVATGQAQANPDTSHGWFSVGSPGLALELGAPLRYYFYAAEQRACLVSAGADNVFDCHDADSCRQAGAAVTDSRKDNLVSCL